ncbi:NUDIX domain-containing protein [Aliigemmobacter aestuarii]|uniref:Putative gamma-glutamylcyclotransferase n=1 Tax=Aliigemmobacter aestuarii TaxID=1445661 RepID=A0A4S3MKB7_9RHOB|nr:NUDIX domain-containing protein [Gemmobacter aestuarii]THD82406.1 NUDIX domain-containing protein [Gemmobacter aestuarii]
MTDLFFYGTLCHAPLLRLVLGREVQTEPARLPGYRVLFEASGAYPLIVPDDAGVADGLLLRGASAEDLARLDFYEGAFGYETRNVPVLTGAGPGTALTYFLPISGFRTAGAWSLDDWARDWGAVVVATAADLMDQMGQRPAAEVAARYWQMLVRGASRLRATEPAPATLRRRGQPDDALVERRRTPYAHYFAVEEYDLRVRRFDGGHGPLMNRAAFVSGDAVTVLPYDPVRDRVLLVEQFRAGPFARGDAEVWQIEAIAGRVDPDETPEQAARREAVEEAGLTLGALLPVANYYPSPGAKTEFLYSYVALTDLPDGCAGIFGLADEAEDIRGHLLDFTGMMALVASGEIANAPLILTALWLERERPRLRAAAGA